MATFHHPQAAPDSLENVLNSLQNVLEHNRYHSQQITNQPNYEPYSNQPAEQYDDPLVLDEPAASVTEALQQHIPVLHDVIETDDTPPTHLAPADIEKSLNTLRTELNGLVADIMIDARQHLEQLDATSQEVMDASTKRFLRDIIERLPS